MNLIPTPLTIEEFDEIILNREFSLDDISNKKLLYEEIEKEANRIFDGPGRNGRTLDMIRRTVTIGKPLEFIFVEIGKGLFELGKHKYDDLVMPSYNNTVVEVKASDEPEKNEYPLTEKLMTGKYNDFWVRADIFYLFRYNNGKYSFYKKIPLIKRVPPDIKDLMDIDI